MYSSLPRFRQYILFTGYMAIVIAIAVLLGWQFRITALKSLLPGITPMNPITAISFILSGVWIILYTHGKTQFRVAIAVIVILVGALHFITYFIPADGLRMDYWLYGNDIRNSGLPNLIPPNTALNFLLCGLSMMLTGKEARRAQVVRQCLLLTSFLLAYTSLLGYVFEIQPAYRFGGLTPMALVTTFAFLFIILGLILADARYGIIKTFTSSLTGGRLMRSIIPLILIIPPFVNYLSLIGAKKGWYSAEFGTQLSTFIFILLLFVFISFYAVIMNRQESQEKEQSQRIETLMKSITEGIIEADGAGNIIFVNEAFGKIMGYSPKEILGASAMDILIPDRDKKKFDERLDRRRKGIEESYISDLVDKSGVQRKMAIHAKPLYDGDGNFKSILISLRDITEEQRNLQDIKTFTDFAAHDLKSPLVNVTMLIEVLKEMQLKPEQMEVVNMLEGSSVKMQKLIDDLLTFSRMGAAELVKEELDISALVYDVLKEIDTARHTIDIEPLPVIEANELTVKQLFTNLISNAIKYSSKASAPRVQIGSYRKGEKVYFYIADNGIGIKPEFLSQMFQPFKRFTSEFKGNGLGLAIVKRIIEKHGGYIEASLNEDGGLRFDFTFTPEKRVL